jgi:predicted regulator of Ras-like GTPase activity (Roadblock/LC7/MglB family)
MKNANLDQKQTSLNDILQRVLDQGEYEAALISDRDGLPLASTGTAEADGMMAAMTALLHEAALQAHRRLDLAYVNELSLVSDDRYRYVCRFFRTATGQNLSLTVMVPPDQAYRRVTNEAIKKIVTTWTSETQ